MCDFMLFGVHERVPTALVDDVEVPGARLHPADRSILPPSFPSEMRAFFLSNGHCSCGLWQSQAQIDTRARRKTASTTAGYRRKKWTQAKIDRATAQRPPPKPGGFAPGIRELVESWLCHSEEVAFAFFLVPGADFRSAAPTRLARTTLTKFLDPMFVPDGRALLLIEA